MIFAEEYDKYIQMTEGYLQEFIDKLSQKPYGSLQEAMAYSLLGHGKRLRPVLVLSTCEMLGGEIERALPFAAAVELVHCYSLIHDDLPAMDDDDYRRGQPSCHKKFDEATAILAGDALLTGAFAEISSAKLPPDRVVAAVRCLSELGGTHGMVGGQALELSGGEMNLTKLQQVQVMKTGALITASCHLGAIAAGANKEARNKLTAYAGALGVAFQIRDDLLDVSGNEKVLGKPVGSDQKSGKVTGFDLIGKDKGEKFIEAFTKEAQVSLMGLPNAEFLQQLAQWLADRDH